MEQIGARVAHVGDSEHVVFDIGAGCRAAHARLAKPVERSLDDRGVCSFDGGRQSCGVGSCGAVLAMVSTAMEEATSPAAWPPMPSHTQKSGDCTR